MLPARSKRYASADGEIPRERLAGNWQLLLLVLILLTLLYVVFPKRALMQRLYDQDQLDELSLAYVQNLFRADTRNADAALLLARHRAAEMDPLSLEQLVLPYTRSGDRRQRNLARQLLLDAYQRQLEDRGDPAERAQLRERLLKTLLRALDDALPEPLARGYAALAYRLNLAELGERLLRPYLDHLGPTELEAYGREALARQQYALASHYFLLARTRSSDTAQARQRFQLGLDALRAGGLYAQALDAADSELGDLASDLPTLRYLVRLALAAGDPVLAAHYAQRLVFRPSEREPTRGTR